MAEQATGTITKLLKKEGSKVTFLDIKVGDEVKRFKMWANDLEKHPEFAEGATVAFQWELQTSAQYGDSMLITFPKEGGGNRGGGNFKGSPEKNKVIAEANALNNATMDEASRRKEKIACMEAATDRGVQALAIASQAYDLAFRMTGAKDFNALDVVAGQVIQGIVQAAKGIEADVWGGE